MQAIPDEVYPELEYRGRFLVQEAWRLAQRAHRPALLPCDLESAWRTFSSDPPAQVWSQHPGSSTCRLVHVPGALRPTPLSLTSLAAPEGGSGASGALGVGTALVDSRAMAARLAEVTLVLRAALEGTGTGGIDELVAQLGSQDSATRLLPAVAAALKASVEATLLGGSTEGLAPAAATAAALPRLQRVLLVLVGLLRSALPIAACAGEFLGLAATLAIHGARPPAPAPAAADIAFRESAAATLAGYAAHFSVVWPEVAAQTSGLLLDAAAEAALGDAQQGSGSGASSSAASASASATAPSAAQISAPDTLLGALASLCELRLLSQAHARVLERLLSALEARWAGDGGSDAGSALGREAEGLTWDLALRRVASRLRRTHLSQ
jgi:hypothetical protein